MSANAELKIDFLCGDSIEDCCKEAVRLAQMLQASIRFDFNGIACIATRYTNPELLAKNWYAVKDVTKTPFVFG